MKKRLVWVGLLAVVLMAPLAVSAANADTMGRGRGPALTTEQKTSMDTYRGHVTEYLDGKITLEQLKKYHDSLIPEEMRKNDANFEARMKLQKDYKEGKVSKEDFIKQMDALRPEGAGKGHGHGPALTDEQKTNRDAYRSHVTEYLDGKISLEQLKKYHDELMPAGINHDDANFEARMKLQKDYKDGKITKEDFIKQMDALRPEGAGKGHGRHGGHGGNGMGLGLGECMAQ